MPNSRTALNCNVTGRLAGRLTPLAMIGAMNAGVYTHGSTARWIISDWLSMSKGPSPWLWPLAAVTAAAAAADQWRPTCAAAATGASAAAKVAPPAAAAAGQSAATAGAAADASAGGH